MKGPRRGKRPGRRMEARVQFAGWTLGLAAFAVLRAAGCPTFASWVPVGRVRVTVERPSKLVARDRSLGRWRVLWGGAVLREG